jgi:hypothetical protein
MRRRLPVVEYEGRHVLRRHQLEVIANRRASREIAGRLRE